MWIQESPDYERQSLRAWAERIGQRPLFLFPEYRTMLPKPESATTSSPVEVHETLPARAKSTLLKMVDAALSQQYGKDWLDGDIPTCVNQWIRELELGGIETPGERRALTRWFNDIAEKRRQ